MSSTAVQKELISYLPRLRAFAISLCGDVNQADDLVQDTVLKGWKSLDAYQEGTNLRAWLFTILRNTYFSRLREVRRRDEVSMDAEPETVRHLGNAASQDGWMDSQDFLKALAQLTHEQREAIILIGAEGMSYEEVAEICGCAIGTIKSRVNRARNRLLDLLGIEQEPTVKL